MSTRLLAVTLLHQLLGRKKGSDVRSFQSDYTFSSFFIISVLPQCKKGYFLFFKKGSIKSKSLFLQDFCINDRPLQKKILNIFLHTIHPFPHPAPKRN